MLFRSVSQSRYKGDRAELAQEMGSRESWQKAGWPILAQIYIQQGKKKEAVELLLQRLPTPALPGRDFSGLEAERRWYRSPRDAAAAFVLSETRRENRGPDGGAGGAGKNDGTARDPSLLLVVASPGRGGRGALGPGLDEFSKICREGSQRLAAMIRPMVYHPREGCDKFVPVHK